MKMSKRIDEIFKMDGEELKKQIDKTSKSSVVKFLKKQLRKHPVDKPLNKS